MTWMTATATNSGASPIGSDRARLPPEVHKALSLEVYVAPLDIRLGADTVLQPDVLVVARSEVQEHRVQGSPILAVEVLSPSTRHIDLGLKLSRYEASQTPSYWVIDPDEPSLRAWDLREGRYEQVAHVTGDEPARLSLPWSVEIVPSGLVDDLR